MNGTKTGYGSLETIVVLMLKPRALFYTERPNF